MLNSLFVDALNGNITTEVQSIIDGFDASDLTGAVTVVYDETSGAVTTATLASGAVLSTESELVEYVVSRLGYAALKDPSTLATGELFSIGSVSVKQDHLIGGAVGFLLSRII